MARTQIERDTARALESLRPPKKFRTPLQKPRPYREPADVIADRVQRKVNTGELKASLSSTALDPETGVLTGTTWEGTLTSHPVQGVRIRQEYQPPELPQADLFMEPGPEVELQRLRSSSGGPWERDEDVYTWMRPTGGRALPKSGSDGLGYTIAESFCCVALAMLDLFRSSNGSSFFGWQNTEI